MPYLLDLPSMDTTHKVKQVKAYLNAMQNPKISLHDAMKKDKGYRLARDRSIQHVCDLTELKHVRDWEKHTVEFKPHNETLLSENLGKHCPDWPAGKSTVEVQMLVEANSKPLDIVIHTNGSVTRDRSGWGFTVKQDGRTCEPDSEDWLHTRPFTSPHYPRIVSILSIMCSLISAEQTDTQYSRFLYGRQDTKLLKLRYPLIYSI